MRRTRILLAQLALALALVGAAGVAGAAPSLEDYKRFRALSIDLLGRMPTRAEVREFEQPGFDLDGWLDQHLQGPDYARRLARVYLDRLRLRVNTAFNLPGNALLRATILDENGKAVWVYYRRNQKRMRDTKNGSFCMTRDEVGFDLSQTTPPGVGARVPQALIDSYTVKVKPWWLYRDYQAQAPVDRYQANDWMYRWGYSLAPALTTEPDGRATTEVRVCREEASELGTAQKDGAAEMVDCGSSYGFRSSSSCGCGRGLERCMPNSNNDGQGSGAMVVATPSGPLGIDPYISSSMSYAAFISELTAQEVERFFQAIFVEDRDFREAVTGRYTYVNGPLAQFYKSVQQSYWSDFSRGYTAPTMLAAPSQMPSNMTPYDTQTWLRVDDRGPLAAGVLTMPVFLRKYATRRSRAHIVYNAFLCKDFVAPPGLKLSTDANPDLTKRDGCNYCHVKLEPLASYFGRVVENDWTWLDPVVFPAKDPNCKKGSKDGTCNTRYDPAFATADAGYLRGAYAAPENADAGPMGLAQSIVASPEFAECVVQNLAEDFLQRPLDHDDDALKAKLVYAFKNGGFKPRALVRELVKSDAYLRANDLTSASWRKQGGGK